MKGSDVFTAPAGGIFIGDAFIVWNVSSCWDFSKVLATSIVSSLEKHSDLF